VAWSADAGGQPVDPAVAEALAPARRALEDIGCEVNDAFPDLSDAGEIFQVLRAVRFETVVGPLYDAHGDELKETVRWNVEQARRLTAQQIGEAIRAQAALQERTGRFMERYDFLALPVTQVPPFGLDVEWVRKVAGVQMETYIDWMRSCSDITVAACPAISVPGGFTGDGLPVGLQLVGRARDDLGVLQIAYAFEQATRHGDRQPPLV
jgi:amidase